MSWCVLCFFFFFKQKTAYEVRISDWSSDVCSSDLVEDHQVRWIDPRPFTHMIATAEHTDPVAVAFQVTGDQFRKGGVVFHQEDVGHGVSRKCVEIGRASCRERVCQYV